MQQQRVVFLFKRLLVEMWSGSFTFFVPQQNEEEKEKENRWDIILRIYHHSAKIYEGYVLKSQFPMPTRTQHAHIIQPICATHKHTIHTRTYTIHTRTRTSTRAHSHHTQFTLAHTHAHHTQTPTNNVLLNQGHCKSFRE